MMLITLFSEVSPLKIQAISSCCYMNENRIYTYIKRSISHEVDFFILRRLYVYFCRK